MPGDSEDSKDSAFATLSSDSEDSSDIALCGLGVLSLSECLTLSVVSHQVEVKNLGKVGSLGSNCLCYSLRRLCFDSSDSAFATPSIDSADCSDIAFAAKKIYVASEGVTVPRRDCRVTLASAQSPDGVRGGDYAMAHLSEVAFWGDDAQRHRSLNI